MRRSSFNLLIFQNKATIGETDTTKTTSSSSIKVVDAYNGRGVTSNNTLAFSNSENKINLAEMSVVGNWYNSAPSTTANILSFNAADNNSGSTTFKVGTLSAKAGANIIGKDLYAIPGSANTTDTIKNPYQYAQELFETSSNPNQPKRKDNFATLFADSKYQAKGEYSIGSVATQIAGNNYLNVETLTIGNNSSQIDSTEPSGVITTASSGTVNLIIANKATINGNILTSGGSNVLILGSSTSSGESPKLTGDILARQGGSNILIFESKPTLGSTNTRDAQTLSSIKVIDTNVGSPTKSNNILVFKGSDNALTLKEISINGNWKDDATTITSNILSFNAATSTSSGHTLKVETLNARNGSNIIGKDLYKEDTTTRTDARGASSTKTYVYDSELFETTNGKPKKKDNFDIQFANSKYQAKGKYSVESIKGDGYIFGGNYINVEELTIGSASSSRETSSTVITAANNRSSNVLAANTLSITGNIESLSNGSNAIWVGATPTTRDASQNTGASSTSPSLTFQGNLYARGTGKNKITASKATITGNLESAGGSNAIYLTNTSEQSTIKGNIYAHNAGNQDASLIILSQEIASSETPSARGIAQTAQVSHWSDAQANANIETDSIKATGSESNWYSRTATTTINVQTLKVGNENTSRETSIAISAQNNGFNNLAASQATINGNIQALGGKNIIYLSKTSSTNSQPSNRSSNQSTIKGDILAQNSGVGNGVNIILGKEFNTTPTSTDADIQEGWMSAQANANIETSSIKAIGGIGNYYNLRGQNTINVSTLKINNTEVDNPVAIYASRGDNAISSNNATITGNIEARDSGSNAIFLGKSTSAPTVTGNITTVNGSNSIILEDGTWTPYLTLQVENSSTAPSLKNTPDSTNNSGILTNNGTTNLILRKSPSSTGTPGVAAIDISTLSIPVYKVVSLKGETNIVMQGDIVASSYISYANGGNVNLLFANNNDNAADSFDASNATDITSNKVLGKTYKDGVKLALSDKQVSIGDKNQSFLETYGHYFSDTFKDGGLLNVTTARVLNNATSGSGKTQTDTVHIQGLALGNISPLASSTAAASSRGVSSQ
uniref:beta strand repeat-containing protein n=1 Tax=Helicobacter cholecystus TaxID=45498 RepID=UPI0027398876